MRNRAIRKTGTEEAILDALKHMICEMEYPQITVTEISHRAHIHRKTFYLHFETLDDAMLAISDEIIRSLKGVLDEYAHSKEPFDFGACLKHCFLSLEGEFELHEKLFCNASYGFVFNRIQDELTRYFVEYLKAQDNGNPEYYPEYVETFAVFAACGINGMRRHQFRSGCPHDKRVIEDIVEKLATIAPFPPERAS